MISGGWVLQLVPRRFVESAVSATNWTMWSSTCMTPALENSLETRSKYHEMHQNVQQGTRNGRVNQIRSNLRGHTECRTQIRTEFQTLTPPIYPCVVYPCVGKTGEGCSVLCVSVWTKTPGLSAKKLVSFTDECQTAWPLEPAITDNTKRVILQPITVTDRVNIGERNIPKGIRTHEPVEERERLNRLDLVAHWPTKIGSLRYNRRRRTYSYNDS